MKKLCLLIIVVALSLAFPSAALAEEASKYNFATAQGAKEITVKPGGRPRTDLLL